jgi:hypothetical protein
MGEVNERMGHSREKTVQHMGVSFGAVILSFEARGIVVLRREYETLKCLCRGVILKVVRKEG